jgi:hypothetical protein
VNGEVLTEELVEAAKRSNNFYRAAFFLLLSFCLGNGVSFLLFGIHTASKSDLDAAATATRQQTDALNIRVGLVESSITRLTAQLQIQKLITTP